MRLLVHRIRRDNPSKLLRRAELLGTLVGMYSEVLVQCSWIMEEVAFDLCAVDADGLGGVSRDSFGGSPPREFDTVRVTLAVRALQRDGFKVLLVSRWELRGSLGMVDVHSVFYVKAFNVTVVDLLKVAREYRCPFLTNVDVTLLEGDWRVPPATQSWLRTPFAEQLQIRFAFIEGGDFELLPSMYLAQRPAAVPPMMLPAPVALPPPSNSMQKVTQWWGEAPCELPASRRGPTPQTESPGGSWHGAVSSSCAPPPPPLLRAPSSTLISVPCASAASVTARGEGLVPPMIGVTMALGGFEKRVLAVLCEKISCGLFSHALDLASTVETGDTEERDNCRLFRERGHQWDHPALIVACKGGARLAAVGFGSNTKARKRAAKLALAVTARVHGLGHTPDPSSDGAFPEMVSLACDCLRDVPDPGKKLTLPRTCVDAVPSAEDVPLIMASSRLFQSARLTGVV